MAGGDTGRVARLAAQLELRVPGVKICGILHQIMMPTRPGIIAYTKKIFNSLASFAWQRLIGILHGSHIRQARESKPNPLVNMCNDRGWPFYSTKDIISPAALAFARQQNADLGVAIGLTLIPEALSTLPKKGCIQGLIVSHGSQGSENATHRVWTNLDSGASIQVHRISPEQKDSLIASLTIHPQPLDSNVSLELKSNLILRDLLVQSVTTTMNHPDSEVEGLIERRMRNLLPSVLFQSEASMVTDASNRPATIPIRIKWKLWVYSLLLVSPFILLRNWIFRLRRQYPVIFLNHHLISDRFHRMGMPTEIFLRQVIFLQRYYRIVSYSEAVRLLQSRAVREPTVALTFDDGYEENFVTLRSVAEETGVPVLLFVSTQFVPRQEEFTHDLEQGIRGFRALNWEQIRYWSNDSAEFGSHTCSHYDCGSTTLTPLEKEIVESKRDLESQTGKPVTAFAFPFGKPENISALALTIASRTYDHFFSFLGGRNFPIPSGSHKHLFRKPLHGNMWENELELQDVFEIAASLKRLLRPRRKRVEQRL